MKLKKYLGIKFLLFYLISIPSVFAQTNESSVTNSAAPSASSVTTGGTNINYQTNNAYNNEMGFGGGVFCRSPTLYFGGNAGQSDLDSFDGISGSGNMNYNISLNAGILVPLGSQVLENCQKLSSIITLDRKISSELSMLKACNELYQKKIPVDADKYPLLERCIDYKPIQEISSTKTDENTIKNKPSLKTEENKKSILKPKSFRELWKQLI